MPSKSLMPWLLALWVLEAGAVPEDGRVPFYLWVPKQTKSRFVDMCQRENVSISAMLTRWASLRASTLPDRQPDEPPAHAHGAVDSVHTASSQESAAPLTSRHTEELPASTRAAKKATEEPPRTKKLRKSRTFAAELSSAHLLQLSEPHLALLRKLARKRRPLLLTWSTGEQKYIDLVLNLALSIRANTPELERRFACVALDAGAHLAMKRQGFHAVLHEVPYESAALKDAVWKMRWLILRTLVRLGIDCLVVDSDMVVLRDPFKALHRDADLEAMTDHFWPERHLWRYWVRPEDNINTGFLFARASPDLERFLAEFLEEHAEPSLGGIPRHHMDQQVFNKFVAQRIFRAESDQVHGLYERMIFRNERAKARAPRPIRVRVLDPVVVAHGMNYFWLRAHEGTTKSPVVAHANGVDSKEYFLRDRGQWYLDDFAQRFGSEGFLTYKHPRGLSLERDFGLLVAAMTLAAALGRRLVLPNTMNCLNCPVLVAHNRTLQDGCTVDYFAWSASFLGHHGQLVVESSLAQHASFRRLSQRVLPSGAETVALLRRSVRELSSGGTRGELTTRRLHVKDVLEVFEGGLQQDYPPWRLFECKFHDWPAAWMACRDQRFVAFHGEFAKCGPLPEQQGCGFRGITCCDPFWGFGEKLEYFTGRRWDLPCNCGLAGCSLQEEVQGEPCCSHAGNLSTQRCIRRPRAPPAVNVPEDTHTYSSSALAEIEELGANGGPEAFWQACSLHRQLRFSDTSAEELLLQCHRLAARYLLLRQNLPMLGEWSRFATRLRLGSSGPRCSGSLQAGALRGIAEALRSNGRTTVEPVFEAASEVEDWLAQASPQASLLEGLHCEALLRLAHAVTGELDLVLEDVQKFSGHWPAGDVLACLRLGSNRLALWSGVANSTWLAGLEPGRTDVVFAFGFSLGRRRFPGLTRRTS